MGRVKKRGKGGEAEREEEIRAIFTLITDPSIARQKILLGTLKPPEYLNKCQIIDRQKWTEKQYEEENSFYFLEAEFGVYLEAVNRAASRRKPQQGKTPPGRRQPTPPRRRR